MTYILNKARSYPVITFFILAYVLTWIITPLVAISPIFGLPGLLMPAISAVITKKMMEGWPGVQDLLRRLILWKIGAGWYFFAIGFPIVVSLIVMYLGVLLGAPNQIQFSPISALSIFVFILVVGEEIGWRGYALPKMLENWAALPASLVLGVLWGLWHLPTFFLPGMPQSNIPFLAFLAYTTALSMLFTWLYLHTRRSLLLATLFHGAIDTFGFINPALDASQRWWLIAGMYALFALIIVIVYGGKLRERRF